jgi:outer membrane protein insertion porin family
MLVLTLPAQAAPPLVRAIDLRSDILDLDRAEVRRLLAVEVGAPLAEDAVRRTLTNLYASGIPGQVELLSAPTDDGGVRLTLVLWANVRVEEIRFEGQRSLPVELLREAVGGGAGQLLSEDRLVRGLYALQDLYKSRGYLAAEVRLAVDYQDRARKRAVVTYRIASGRPARVGAIGLEGDPGSVPRAELLERLALKPGAPYRPARAAEAAERLRRSLVERGFRLAQVSAPSERFDPGQNRVDLVFPVAVGPRFELVVRGTEQAALERRGLLPFWGPEGFDEALLLQAVRRIQRFYQEKGHYQVRVEPTSERSAELYRVVLTVEPGPVFAVAEVAFEGNQQVPTSALEPRLTTAPKRLLELGSGRLIDEELAADVANLRAFYASLGYTAARVGPARVEVLPEARLRVVVPIVEGERRPLLSLRFEGNTVLDAATLGRALADAGLLTSGGPFLPVLVEDSVRTVRALYEEAGYASAQVSARDAWNAEGGGAEVVIEVLEGPLTRVDRVIVRGQQRTDPELVRRIVGLEPGEAVSRSSLLSAQRDLYRLGAFASAEVTLSPSEPGANTRDVVVRLEEGKTRRVVYGLGYDTEDGVRGLLGFSRSNVFGRGYTLGASLRLSEKDNLARLTFDQPYSFGLRLPLTYTLFVSDETRPSFSVEKRGARVEAVRDFGAHVRSSLVYDFRLVSSRLDDSAVLGAEGEPAREDQDIRISSLIPNVLLDYRDDPVDPKSGWSTFAQLQYAFPLGTATESFLKLFVQQTYLRPLRGFGVLAGSFRLGAIEPYRDENLDPTLDPSLPSARVSIAERFFGGGANSHRAYGRDELGEPGSTLTREGLNPRGGNGVLLLNLDYRFPILGDVGGVVFVDAGNVWAGYRDIDPAELKLGAGLGLRYASPIGPVRLEVGWKLDREPGEDSFAWFLWIGNPF